MKDNSGYGLIPWSSFPTIRTDICVKKEIGKYYYEFIIDSIGSGTHLGQIGWIDDKSIPSNYRRRGVGDDAHSWAFDGGRVVKWNNDKESYGTKWKVGDVVGCCIDVMDNKNTFEVSYYLN
eukprot:529836_1